MATQIFASDFASGYIGPGQTLGWWWEPDSWGQIPIFTVQAVAGAPTEKQVEVTRVFHITKSNGERQGNVFIKNTGSNGCFYLISWARVFN